MHYDLRDLRLLVAVVDEGGIAAAARSARISVSAISERIKALEDSASLVFLTRSARGSVPTPAGRELAAHARAVLLQAARLDGAVSALKGRTRGTIKLLANSNAIVSFLPEILASFLARYPEVVVDMKEMTSDEIGRDILAGEADVGVAAEEGPLDGLEFIPFRTDRLVLLVPTHHHFATRNSIAFSESLDEHFIGLDDQAAIQTFLMSRARHLGRELSIRVRLRSFDGVARMVAAGAGVAVVPASIVSRAIQVMGARSISLTDSWAVRKLVVCLAKERKPSRLIESLVQQITDPRTGYDKSRRKNRPHRSFL